jgi:hypothetical protein
MIAAEGFVDEVLSTVPTVYGLHLIDVKGIVS